MPKNDPTKPDPFRQPRLKILYNGSEIPGAISASVTSNNFYQADTFRATFALNASKEYGVAWWGDDAKKQILLDIQFSMDNGKTWTSQLIGQVDHMSIALEAGRCEVDGRDLTAYFIDNRTQETHINKTSSQVVQELAAKRGLQADVTPTTSLVGRYYSDDHDRINMGEFTRTTTEWNLMCGLAQHEQFDVYVTGTTVHFHPRTPEDDDPYLVVWDGSRPWSNAITLDVERSMSIAKDIVVQVRSWHSAKAKSITKFSPSGSRAAAVTSGKEQLYSFTIPNLTEAQAQERANQIRAELTQRERLFSFTIPADLILQPRMLVKFSGSGSGWDQVYHVDSVTRSMSGDGGGFTMSVKTKNHTAQTTVLTG